MATLGAGLSIDVPHLVFAPCWLANARVFPYLQTQGHHVAKLASVLLARCPLIWCLVCGVPWDLISDVCIPSRAPALLASDAMTLTQRDVCELQIPFASSVQKRWLALRNRCGRVVSGSHRSGAFRAQPRGVRRIGAS